jgi:hypothetical protein
MAINISSTAQEVNVSSFLGEVSEITIPSDDYTSTNIRIVWEPVKNSRDIAVIPNADISKFSTHITFTIPEIIANKVRDTKFSVRDGVGKVLIYGIWTVKPAALLD